MSCKMILFLSLPFGAPYIILFVDTVFLLFMPFSEPLAFEGVAIMYIFHFFDEMFNVSYLKNREE